MKYKVGDYVRISYCASCTDLNLYGKEGKVARIVKILSDNMVVARFDNDNVNYYIPVSVIKCKVAGKGNDAIDREKELKDFAKKKDNINMEFEGSLETIESDFDMSDDSPSNIRMTFISDDGERHSMDVSDFKIYKDKDSSLDNISNISGHKNDNAEHFSSIAKGMLETYIKKNHDYGNSFDQSLDRHGLIASIVRMSDKMNRLESLVEKESEVKDESIGDTLLDLANYCIMTKMWMDNKDKSC